MLTRRTREVCSRAQEDPGLHDTPGTLGLLGRWECPWTLLLDFLLGSGSFCSKQACGEPALALYVPLEIEGPPLPSVVLSLHWEPCCGMDVWGERLGEAGEATAALAFQESTF